MVGIANLARNKYKREWMKFEEWDSFVTTQPILY